MCNSARTASVTGTLQVGGQPGMPVGLSLESSYLVVDSPLNRDAVAVEFLRRSRVRDVWQLQRTDRPDWQIKLGDLPATWLRQVRRASISALHRTLWAVALVSGLLLVVAWITRS